jgi:glycosyltransferase involved in cell wall biosynthesis
MLSPEIRRDFCLLLVGIQDAVMADFRKAVDEMGIGESCLLHGFAREEDMAGLISNAEVMWYPSLSEGFGLPILDAFTCETAVLTSNTSSMPEVSGDAAVTVNPENYPEMADRLAFLLNDDSIRREYIRRGCERVKLFTWSACARRAAEVFEEVLEETL